MNAALRRVGLIGWPCAHSLSPLMHQFWMRQAGLPERVYEILPTPADRLEERLGGLAEAGFVGCNITVPHKQAAFAFVRVHGSLDANASRLQAVNTILVDEHGRLHGRNSDGAGFIAGLDEQAPGWRNNAGGAAPGATVLLGAGGAARAILAALAESGCKPILVVNRTPARAEQMLRDLQIAPARACGASAQELHAALQQARLLINATSLGMDGASGWQQAIGSAPETFLASVPAGAIVADIVYAPLRTELLAAARRRGLTCVDGLGMLLHQAVPCFEAWFGVRPQVTPALRRRLEAALAARHGESC